MENGDEITDKDRTFISNYYSKKVKTDTFKDRFGYGGGRKRQKTNNRKDRKKET